VQIVAASSRNKSQEGISKVTKNLCYCDEKQEKKIACGSMQDTGFSLKMGDGGIEPTTR
jgi:hypothetical protein